MLLKIVVDPEFGGKGYEDLNVNTCHDIYAEVSSANRRTECDEFYLKECPIISDSFDGLPIRSMLTVYPDSAVLSCEWDLPEKDVLNYLTINVEVQECDRFPPLRG